MDEATAIEEFSELHPPIELCYFLLKSGEHRCSLRLALSSSG